MNFLNPLRFNYWPQIAAFIVLIGAYVAYRHFTFYDTRSVDAYVTAHVITMSSLVSGPITAVYVVDNQQVKKGDKLVDVDPIPYLNAMKKATATLKLAQENNETQQVLLAKANLDQANYLVQHTTLVAPTDGYITHFDLAIGDFVKEGQSLFALIDPARWWVISRYRETNLRLIKPGDRAEIRVDMYPGKTFHGHVSNISWGINRAPAGNGVSSPLIYSEATEDWVKIAQRFPVNITIDDWSEHYPLRVGASAETVIHRR